MISWVLFCAASSNKKNLDDTLVFQAKVEHELPSKAVRLAEPAVAKIYSGVAAASLLGHGLTRFLHKLKLMVPATDLTL